jgi:hypothetical protein
MSAPDSSDELREVPALPGIFAGRDGSIWDCRSEQPKIINPWPHDGYMRVSLYVAKRKVNRSVHRLVLEAFVGPCPPGMECCHENGVRSDNRLGNIRWGTHLSNVADSVRHGTFAFARWTGARGMAFHGERNGRAKLSKDDALAIRRLYAAKAGSMLTLGRQFGVSAQVVCDIVHHRMWSSV